MEKAGIFEQLVSKLSSDERQEFMSKLQSTEDIASVSVVGSNEEVLAVSWERKFQEMGWFEKFVLYLKGFFSGKPKEELVQDKILEDLTAEIDRQIPGLMNFKIGLFLTGFYEELRLLLSALSVFRKPLAKAFGNERGDFFAFLVGLEIPDVQRLLIDTTNPWVVYEENRERPSKDIKQLLDGNLRVALDSISNEKRHILFQSVKTLYALRNLVMLQEDKILGPFQILSVGTSGGNAGFDEVKSVLIDLWNKLCALPVTPSSRVLEGLFLFYVQEDLNAEGTAAEDALDKKVQELLDLSRQAVQTLKSFHTRIPLGKIMAYLYNNLALKPEPQPAPDDWFGVYRKFWQDKMGEEFRFFSRDRARKMLMQDMHEFLGVSTEEWEKSVFYPPYYRSRVPAYAESVLILCKFFMQNIFAQKMNTILKVILLDGQFYKKNNRESFLEGYNFILLIPERLSFFVKNFQQQGDWGKQLSDLPQFKTELQKIERVKDVFLMAGDWVAVFIKNILETGQVFYEVLHGLVHGKTGQAYDTLVNLGQIGGKSNATFRKELQNTLHRWERFLRIVRELQNLEDVHTT